MWSQSLRGLDSWLSVMEITWEIKKKTHIKSKYIILQKYYMNEVSVIKPKGLRHECLTSEVNSLSRQMSLVFVMIICIKESNMFVMIISSTIHVSLRVNQQCMPDWLMSLLLHRCVYHTLLSTTTLWPPSLFFILI